MYCNDLSTFNNDHHVSREDTGSVITLGNEAIVSTLHLCQKLYY